MPINRQQTQRITRSRARQIALRTVGGGRVVKTELDREDGILVYEATIHYGRYEYEVHVNARNGNVIKVERELID